MQPKAFLFALGAAFLWGAAPMLGKLGLVKADPAVALVLRSFVICGILTVWAAIGGRLPEVGALITTKSGMLIAAEGVLASLLGHLAYYYALKYGEASRVVPVASSFPLFALVLAFFLLGERPSWDKVLGVALIVGGVLLLKR